MLTTEQKAERITNIIHKTALHRVKKVRVYHKFHSSRAEKLEFKLRTEMKRFCQKHRKEILDPKSPQFEELKKKRARIHQLQESQKRIRERYLDKKISESYDNNDIRKLQALIDSYISNKPPKDIEISCVRDKNGIARTKTSSILDTMTDYWTDFYTHEEDKKDMENFDIDRAAGGQYRDIYDKDITKEEVEQALKT